MAIVVVNRHLLQRDMHVGGSVPSVSATGIRALRNIVQHFVNGSYGRQCSIVNSGLPAVRYQRPQCVFKCTNSLNSRYRKKQRDAPKLVMPITRPAGEFVAEGGGELVAEGAAEPVTEGDKALNLVEIIGTASVEAAWQRFQTDGKWGKLTNNALRNILMMMLKVKDSEVRSSRVEAVFDVMTRKPDQVTIDDKRIVLASLTRGGNWQLGARMLHRVAKACGWDDQQVAEDAVRLAMSALRQGESGEAEKIIGILVSLASDRKKLRQRVFSIYHEFIAGPTLFAENAVLAKLLLRHFLPIRRELRWVLNDIELHLPPENESTRQSGLQHVTDIFEAIQQLHSAKQMSSDLVDSLYVLLVHTCVQYKGLAQASVVTARISPACSEGATHANNMLIGAHMAQGDIMRAERIFETMPNTQITRDINTYNAMMGGLVKAAGWSAAHQNLLKAERYVKDVEQLELPKNTTFYNILIQLRGKRLGIEGAFHAMQQMAAAGHQQDVITLSTLLVICRKSDDATGAMKIIEAFRKSGKRLNRRHYDIILPIIARHQDMALLNRFKSLMRQDKVKLELKDPMSGIMALITSGDEAGLSEWAAKQAANAAAGVPIAGMIHHCLQTIARKGETIAMWRFIQILQREGCEPGTSAFNVMLKALTRKGQLQSAEEVLKRMIEMQVPLDRITVNTMITICVDAGELLKANRYFRLMLNSTTDSTRKALTPDRFTYATLIDANAKRGMMNVASRFLASMHMRGVEPDLPVYHCMLRGYARLGDEENVGRIVNEVIDRKLEVTSRTYNSIISGFNQGGYYEQATWWYEQMIAAGIPGDIYTNNDRLQVLVAQGDMAAAVQLFDRIKTDGSPYDRVSYNILMAGWCKVGNSAAAELLLANMKTSRFPPDYTTYTILISFYAKQQHLKKSLFLFQEWLAEAQRKSLLASEPFAAIIHACGVLNRNLPQAVHFWRMMEDLNIEPSSSVYTCMMQVYSRHGDFEDVLAIFKRLLARCDGGAVGVEAPTACVVLDACGLRKDRKALYEVWHLLRENEPRLKIASYEWENVFNSMIEALIHNELFEEAVRVLTQEMVQAKVKPTAKTFRNSIIMMQRRQCDQHLIETVKSFQARWERSSRDKSSPAPRKYRQTDST
ncbi:hypothetical protein DFJ77DRAFT_462267 [Powellomyces hirtus]|nr:hypothetical protein DFJ77DRAFT_462267 [Powellomyces hirtus]